MSESGETEKTLITDEEIRIAISNFTLHPIEAYGEDSMGGKLVDSDIFLNPKGQLELVALIISLLVLEEMLQFQ
ncbi:hypothetical protein AAAC51_07140 [Priestia megaterium]